MQVTCLVTTLHPFQWRPIASYSCPFAVASKDGLLPNPKTAYALQRPLRSRGFRLSDYYMRKTLSQPPKLIVVATNVNIGSGNYNEDDTGPSTIDGKAKEKNLVDLTQPSDKNTASLQAAGVTALLIVFATVAAVIAILSSGGPTALVTAISKSGFFAAFALIFVSEIGDKTFFIAALLAMRHSRALVLLGASGALALMTIISVIIGRVFQSVPAQLQTTLPVGEYAAVALLLLFGARSIKSAWDLPSAVDTEENVTDETGELAEAQEFLKKSEAEKKLSTPLAILGESFSLVFMAEWGDRSMLATIALGAAQSPFGVASGAIVGHVLATWLAVLGWIHKWGSVSCICCCYSCGSLLTTIYRILNYSGSLNFGNQENTELPSCDIDSCGKISVVTTQIVESTYKALHSFQIQRRLLCQCSVGDL